MPASDAAETVRVRFPDTPHADLDLPVEAELSEHLTAGNSPLLFGCRTGICGTCACLLEGAVPGPDEDEREVLEATAPDLPGARLACQVRLTADVSLRPLPEDARP